MQPRLAETLRVWVRCQVCGAQTDTHEVPGDGYGDWMGRTRHNELAELDALHDPVFEEVVQILKELLAPIGRERYVSDCLSDIFSEACDAAPSGERYLFSARFWCSACGAECFRYAPYEPPQVDTIELPLVTHVEWNALSAAEKRHRLVEAVNASGCLASGSGGGVRLSEK